MIRRCCGIDRWAMSSRNALGSGIPSGWGQSDPRRTAVDPEELHQVLDVVLLEGSDPYVGAERFNRVTPQL